MLLLKAAVRSNPELSSATMRRVVAQLVTGEALADALPTVLCRQMLVLMCGSADGTTYVWL